MSIILTFLINVFNLVLVYVCYPGMHSIFEYVGKFIFITQILSHAYTVLFNPGIPNKNLYLSDKVVDFVLRNSEENKSIFDNYRICKKCNILLKLEESTVHCEECGICLIGNYNGYIIYVFGYNLIIF